MAKKKNAKKEAQLQVEAAGDKNGPSQRDSEKKELERPRKSAAKKAPAKAVEKGPGFFVRTRQFFREVRIELKKVTWPSRKETIASTSVVVVLVLLVAVYLGLVDMGLSRAIKYLLH
ncbi:MAG: preprotein translocase subunit SecE [Pseudomonadota bacterium]